MIKALNLDDLDLVNSLIIKTDQNLISCDSFNHPFNKYAIYIKDLKAVGFISYALMYDRIEINYIYVDELYRRQNIASELLAYLIDISKSQKVINISLEVRTGNMKAINLYKKYNFKEIAKRQNYYGNEDGLLMIREMINNG